jgi:methionine-rich copper-binding protein CopC
MSASTPDFDLPRLPAHRRISAIIAVLLALGLSLVGAGRASAHTGFESSTPTDGAAIDEAVELVTIVFTGEANPVGDKFVALTAAGVLQEPTSVQTLDNKLFSLRFEPALAGGQVGIRWHVQAADAHPIEGAFSFTVNAPAPTTTSPATTLPATTLPTTALRRTRPSNRHLRRPTMRPRLQLS